MPQFVERNWSHENFTEIKRPLRLSSCVYASQTQCLFKMIRKGWFAKMLRESGHVDLRSFAY